MLNSHFPSLFARCWSAAMAVNVSLCLFACIRAIYVTSETFTGDLGLPYPLFTNLWFELISRKTTNESVWIVQAPIYGISVSRPLSTRAYSYLVLVIVSCGVNSYLNLAFTKSESYFCNRSTVWSVTADLPRCPGILPLLALCRNCCILVGNK